MFDSASSLDEILGVAIGFSTIMLLLSLIVTAIVQIVQNALFLRFKNLSLAIFTARGYVNPWAISLFSPLLETKTRLPPTGT